MSKLLEKLRRAAQSDAPRIGFGVTTATQARRSMVLVAELKSASADLAAGAVEQGADALYFAGAGVEDESTGQKLAEAAGEAIWGASLSAPSPAGLAGLRGAGADFVIVSQRTPLRALQEEEPPRLLEVEISLSDTLLRTLERLPIEAALLTVSADEPLMRDLMEYQRVALLVRKPILLRAEAGVAAESVSLLRQVGFDGIVVAVEDEASLLRLAEFRQAIENLPTTTRSGRHHVDVTLPPSSSMQSQRLPDDRSPDV